MVSLEVPNDRLNRLSAFEKPTFFIREPLVFAALLDLNARVVSVHAPVTQIGLDSLWPDPQALHQSCRLFDLFIQCVAIVGVARKASGPHDQVSLKRRGQTVLDPKFVGFAALPLVDAFHLRCVPTV